MATLYLVDADGSGQVVFVRRSPPGRHQLHEYDQGGRQDEQPVLRKPHAAPTTE